MRLTRILGAPGTGKTHKMLELLEKELDAGTPAQRIAYLSFTRKGTYQGVDLAKEMFDLTDDDCKYFKTLHSICFHAIAEKTGIQMRFLDKDMKEKLQEMFKFTDHEWEQMVQQSSIARNKVEDLDIRDFSTEHKAGQLLKIATMFDSWRDDKKYYDFTDVLEKVLEYGITLDVDVVFIDEAQDMTVLQWKVIDQLFANAKHMYLAGDSNQSLFKWAGADVKRFTDVPCEDTIFLANSYRCSKSVWRYAQLVHADMTEKEPIPDECNEELGFALVTDKNPLAYLPKLARKGSVYCLAYTNGGLKVYKDYCNMHGIPYKIKTDSAEREEPLFYKLYELLKLYYETLTKKDTYDLYFNRVEAGIRVPMKINGEPNKEHDRLKRRRALLKKLLNGTPPHFGYTQKDDELITNFVKAYYIKRKRPMPDEFIRSLVVNKYYLLNPIVLSVVHRIKGGEADFVFMKTNIPRSGTTARKIKDINVINELNSVLFVGITRARSGVILFHDANGASSTPVDNLPPLGDLNYYLQPDTKLLRRVK